MKDFYDGLRKSIAGYEGRHEEFIYLAPEWYRLLTNLLDIPRLPKKLKPLVCCGIAYFILPADVIPEDVYGPYGYIDDIYFSAYVANQVAERSADKNLLYEAWEGEGDVVKLVSDILDREKELLEDKCEAILRYTGTLELLGMLEAAGD